MQTITSRQNPIVAAFRELADTPDPAGRRLLLDGVHLVREALDARVEFELAAVAASRLEAPTDERALVEALRAADVEVITVTDTVFDAMSPVRTPSGIAAVARRPLADADAIAAAPGALVIVAIDVQDPGNLGSLVRAAEAGGATGLLVCGSSANPFAWKALRGSMGSALRLPIATRVPVEDALAVLRRHGVRIIAAVPRGGVPTDTADWTGAVAILLGGEGAGLPREVIDAADGRVTIPMAAQVESLNVAVSGALLVYEARRQRQ